MMLVMDSPDKVEQFIGDDRWYALVNTPGPGGIYGPFETEAEAQNELIWRIDEKRRELERIRTTYG